ncbi:MAG: Ig-like domain-containing protein [Hylemonella sp.]|nr:Ig-like domain-containing protein [Hylemonella sp.]
MRYRHSHPALFIASSVLSLTLGCGGGSSSGANAPVPVTLSGIVATGAAFSNSTVTVHDRTGTAVGTNVKVGNDGQYSVTLPSDAKAPFVLTATRTTADGATDSLVSVVPATNGDAATANITPVTHLMASRLSLSGNPLKLAGEVATGAATVDVSAVAVRKAEAHAIIEPVLTATGSSSVDPLTATFVTDGSGYDRLLDSLRITVTPAGETHSNIEVAIKQRQAEANAPVVVQFTSNTATAPSLSSDPSVNALNLVPEGTVAKIAAHLAQLTTCYALPTYRRVSTPNPTGVAATSTSSVDISAPECRSAFFQDNSSGDILYKSNGAQIGAVSGQHFRGLFYDAATGLAFSQGSYEFTRENGDIVAGHKSFNPNTGAETYDVFVLRLDPTDGKLKQIGNQYVYPGRVSAYQQHRRFITLNQSAWDYVSTGYTVNVSNLVDGAGNPVFDRVAVTAPNNMTFVLRPTAGSSYLVLETGSGLTRTNFVRLRAEYLDPAKAGEDPSTKDNGSNAHFFADRTIFTNDVISQFPMQGVWKYEYFLAGNVGTVPDTTQYYKTRARALTIPELKMRSFATLTSANVASLQSMAIPAGQVNQGQISIGGLGAVGFSYEVLNGALPPTIADLFGRYSTPSVAFNDNIGVSPSATSATITCNNQTSIDQHCVNGVYDSSALMQAVNLWARDPLGNEFGSVYAAYTLQ